MELLNRFYYENKITNTKLYQEIKVNRFEGKTLTSYDEPELIVKDLINKGVKNCVVTDGGNPTYYNDGKEIKIEPTIKASKVVNTTGAGDAMLSGVVYGLINNKSITEAIQIGHKFANANLQVETPTLKNKMNLSQRQIIIS